MTVFVDGAAEAIVDANGVAPLVALLAGVVSLSDVPVVWDIVWNATGAFVAIIVISLLLDEAGFFEWAALHVARWAKGSGHRLFCFCVLLGAAACFALGRASATIPTPNPLLRDP